MKIKIDKKAVGLRIKQIRLNKGYTLKEFGKIFDTSDSIVYRWEQGTALPNKERIKQITKFADITVHELIYGSIEEFVNNNLNNIYNYISDTKNIDFKSYEEYDSFYNNTMNFIKDSNLNINNIDFLKVLIDIKFKRKEILTKQKNATDDFLENNKFLESEIHIKNHFGIFYTIMELIEILPKNEQISVIKSIIEISNNTNFKDENKKHLSIEYLKELQNYINN